MNCMQCAKVLSLHSKTFYPNAIKIERCFGCGIPMKKQRLTFIIVTPIIIISSAVSVACKKGHFQKVRDLNKNAIQTMVSVAISAENLKLLQIMEYGIVLRVAMMFARNVRHNKKKLFPLSSLIKKKTPNIFKKNTTFPP